MKFINEKKRFALVVRMCWIWSIPTKNPSYPSSVSSSLTNNHGVESCLLFPTSSIITCYNHIKLFNTRREARWLIGPSLKTIDLIATNNFEAGEKKKETFNDFLSRALSHQLGASAPFVTSHCQPGRRKSQLTISHFSRTFEHVSFKFHFH